jgi:hypothetical protein
MIRPIISFLFLLTAFTGMSQTKTYTGAYEYDNKSGTATYSYIPKDGEEVLHGPFSFKSKLGVNGTFVVTGAFENDLKNGNWNNTSTWSIYNDEEHTKSDFIFARVTQFRPFVEITKKQTIPFTKGKLNGKEVLLFTKKESWGASGGGQKTIVYKKEKTWKDDVIQDFSFETLENNVRKEFLKGKYAVVGDMLVYDGEWTGMVDGKSIRVVFDKGIMKSVLTKNQSTGAVLKQETYQVDTELMNKFNDKNYITVTFNRDNAKLNISKIDNGKYDFEVISSNVSEAYPDDYIKPLVSYINYVEKANPYDNQYGDNEWTAGISTLTKKYLSNNRQKADFWSVKAYDENANKIFEIIDESDIEFIGSGKDFFLQNSDDFVKDPNDVFSNLRKDAPLKSWANEKPSYFNQSMYIKYLLYKGKADKVLNLFSQAEQAKVFIDENYSGWGMNSVGTMPFYFMSLCLAGDLNEANKVIQNNINNVQTYKDGSTEKWIETVSNDIKHYLPFIQKTYPQDRIAFLQNIAGRGSDIKNSSTNAYFDNLPTVKVGQLTWTATPISMEQIDISASAIRDGHDKYGNKYQKTVVILNYLQTADLKKFDRKGWRLPTVNELKDLFARNLSDYDMKIFGIDPMAEDELVYVNNYKELRFIAKDTNGKLVVYNGTKNVVINPTPNDKHKVSGMCLLIKTE